MSHFTVAVDDKFFRGQSHQSNGSAGVQFVGRNAYFSTEPEFESVSELSGGIDHDGGRIHGGDEFLHFLMVVADDRIGVVRAKRLDVTDSVVDAVDDAQ